MNVLEAVEIYRFYHTGDDEIFALRGVSLQLQRGELVAVMGPSGSGKSTLLGCLAGLDEPDGGHVELMGRRVSRRPESERAALRAQHIGILRQNGNLFDHLTVAGNIHLQLALAGRRPEAKRLDAMLHLLGVQTLLDAQPSQLSGGEAARAALAVALAGDPVVLLADEPTAEVDLATAAWMLELLMQRQRDGGAAIVATHSDIVAERCDRVLELRDGRLVHG